MARIIDSRTIRSGGSKHKSGHTPAARATAPARRQLTVRRREVAGRITTAGRRGLQRGQFALPATAVERRRGIGGRFPMDTLARARNALGRMNQAQVGLSTADRARVRSRVFGRFPQLRTGSVA